MFFFPFGILILILFILLLPVLLILGYFHIVTIGFEKLGLSAGTTILILVLMLIASGINIPLTRKKIIEVEEKSFFGLFRNQRLKASGLSINLGGAVIPVLLSLYFLSMVPLGPILTATLFMIISLKFLARIVPGRGITIPALLPPFLALVFALILAPDFAAPCAFISGVFGTLIGGDILNLRRAVKMNPGMISIGGAGVFDGIFLVGIISTLLT